MATFKFEGIDKYQALLNDLGAKATGCIKRAVFVGSDVVINQIRRNLEGINHKDTGSLLKSLGLQKMTDKNGFISTKVGWTAGGEDYDSKGTPNALKAAALESGVSGKNYPKTHFISRAVKAATAPANERMSKQLDHDIEAINKKYGG